MKKIKLYSALLLLNCLTGCSSNLAVKAETDNARTTTSTLLENAENLQGADRYASCVLLGELYVDDGEYKRIEQRHNQNNKDICYLYVLTKGEAVYANGYDRMFIKNFPAIQETEQLWQYHRESGYPVSFLPPYIQLLADLSYSDDQALYRLLSLLDSPSGSTSEDLNGRVYSVYKANPDRFNRIFSEAGFGSEELDAIKSVMETP